MSKKYLLKFFQSWYFTGISLVLCSCSLAPKYEKPKIEIPTGSVASDNCFKEFNKSEWWSIFNDTTLNDLQKKAINNNSDLKKSIAVVEEAMAVLKVNEADLFPSVNLNWNSNKYSLSTEGKSAARGGDRDFRSYGLGLAFSFELDLFGKNRNLSKAAFNEMLATRFAKEVVYLTITSSVAKSYFSLLALSKKLDIANRTLATRKETYEIYKTRFRNGYCTELDLKRIEAEYCGVKAKVHSLEISKSSAKTALALLIGEDPKDIIDYNMNGSISGVSIINSIPKDVPSDLLLKRPDIAAVEHKLIAANARIGAVRAAFFPSISLNSAVGYEGDHLSTLFGSHTDYSQVGLASILQLFQGGKTISNEKAAKAKYAQMLEDYKNTVRTAFKEVYDSIISNDKNREILQLSNSKVIALEEGYSLTSKQKESGLIGLIDLLDVERNLLAAQIDQVDAIYNVLISIVDLCRSTGCGLRR